MHGAIHLFDRLPEVEVFTEAESGPMAAPARSEPLIGLIRNPHSHRNEGVDAGYGDSSNIVLASPRKRSELHDIIADFAARQVDYIAIDGGDGTVRDILTCGASAFGQGWPELILLPSGKTNALAHDLGINDNWTLAKAVEAAKADNVVIRRPLVISQRDNEGAQVRGFVLGAGAYTRAIMLGQEAHDFGAFNSMAVGMTAIWSALQAIFGGRNNAWRSGTRLRLRNEAGEEIQHIDGASDDERLMIFASSLQRFPAGLNPFRPHGKAEIHLAVFDKYSRRLLLHLPWIFRGTFGQAAIEAGFHTHELEEFAFDIADRFILDGEAFPPGSYRVTPGPRLRFVVP